MLDMRMVPAAEVPAAIAGRVLLWFGEDGVLYRKEASDVAIAVGVGPKGDSGALWRAKRTDQLSFASGTETVIAYGTIKANTLEAGDVLSLQSLARFTSGAISATASARLRVGAGGLLVNAEAALSQYVSTVAQTNISSELAGMFSVRAGVGGNVTLSGVLCERRQLQSTVVGANTSAVLTLNPTVDNYIALTYSLSSGGAAPMVFESVMMELRR